MKTPKQKHMSYTERLHIQELLNQNQSFSKTAKVINKNRTTVYREVYNYRFLIPVNANIEECTLLEKAPFVCNGCSKRKIVVENVISMKLILHKMTIKH